MRTLVLAGIAALGVAAGVPAWGGTATRFRGSELVGPCHDFLASVDRNLVQQGICVGQIWAAWVVAVTDAAVCIPQSVTLGQVMHVTVLYIDQHPARLDAPFLALARWALIEAWPCKPVNEWVTPSKPRVRS
jgi:Ssp1 endopeptidase immunity protein Rap1a